MTTGFKIGDRVRFTIANGLKGDGIEETLTGPIVRINDGLRVRTLAVWIEEKNGFVFVFPENAELVP